MPADSMIPGRRPFRTWRRRSALFVRAAGMAVGTAVGTPSGDRSLAAEWDFRAVMAPRQISDTLWTLVDDKGLFAGHHGLHRIDRVREHPCLRPACRPFGCWPVDRDHHTRRRWRHLRRARPLRVRTGRCGAAAWHAGTGPARAAAGGDGPSTNHAGCSATGGRVKTQVTRVRTVPGRTRSTAADRRIGPRLNIAVVWSSTSKITTARRKGPSPRAARPAGTAPRSRRRQRGSWVIYLSYQRPLEFASWTIER